MNKTTFRDRMAVEMAALLPEFEVGVDPSGYGLRLRARGQEVNCGDYVLDLGSTYRMCRGENNFRELVDFQVRILRYMVDAIPRDEGDWERVRPRLAMQLRRRPGPPAGLPPEDPARWDPVSERTVFPDLDLCVYIDSPDAMMLVQAEHVKRWGQDRATVLVLARRQTPAHLPQWRLVDVAVAGRRVYVASDTGGYACSAIAFPKHLAKLGVPLQRLWVAAPSRDVAIAFEGGDPDSDPLVPIMAGVVARQYVQFSHPICPALFQVRGRGEVLYVSALPDPARQQMGTQHELRS